MTTQAEKTIECYATIMSGDKVSQIVKLVPEKIRTTVSIMINKPFGAFICQAENEPDTYNEMADLFTMHDVYRMLRDMENALYKSEILDKEVIDGVDTYICSHAWERVQALTTVENVSSLFVYYIQILLVRSHGKAAYDKSSASESKDDSDSTPPGDWTPDDSPLQCLFWESLSFRDQKALQYVGLDILHYPDPAVSLKLASLPTILERLNVLFETPKYKSYKTFVYDKSITKALDSVGWLKAKAKRLIKYTVDQGASPSATASLKVCVDLYTANMRTSTTGAMLGSSRSVFSPKPVEGTRLLKNLFEHHIHHCVLFITKDMADFMELAVKNIDKFEELEYNRERPDYRLVVGRRVPTMASARRV